MRQFILELDRVRAELGIQDGGPNSFRAVPFQVDGGPKNRVEDNTETLIIFWYATVQNLTVAETLPLFGEHFEAVVQNTEGTDYPNIRALMKHNRDAYVGSIVSITGKPVVPRVWW